MSDASLAQLLKAHQQRQAERKRENGTYGNYIDAQELVAYCWVDQLRKDAVNAVNELTDSLNTHLNEG